MVLRAQPCSEKPGNGLMEVHNWGLARGQNGRVMSHRVFEDADKSVADMMTLEMKCEWTRKSRSGEMTK